MADVTLLLVVCVVLCVTCVGARPPENLPLAPIDVDVDTKTELTRPSHGDLHTDGVGTLKKRFNRLPGVCRRLKRRRITILCNVEKYCSARRDSLHGHICPCPKASRCTHFYLKSF
ncbi:uncharacterized protein [Salminus brasiliensis]|uniref:uncharacterized protein n=1 Tax=Salminus brasiliensis TaxID=930266 RepID=UPI003B839D33